MTAATSILCPRCRKRFGPRRPAQSPLGLWMPPPFRAPRRRPPTRAMAAGQVLFSPGGSIYFSPGGNVMISNGAGDECCCGDPVDPPVPCNCLEADYDMVLAGVAALGGCQNIGAESFRVNAMNINKRYQMVDTSGLPAGDFGRTCIWKYEQDPSTDIDIDFYFDPACGGSVDGICDRWIAEFYPTNNFTITAYSDNGFAVRIFISDDDMPIICDTVRGMLETSGPHNNELPGGGLPAAAAGGTVSFIPVPAR